MTVWRLFNQGRARFASDSRPRKSDAEYGRGVMMMAAIWLVPIAALLLLDVVL